MSNHIISINALHKTYQNGVTALQDVSLDIPQGDFFALLGPNGAGKSTLIGILCGLATKTSGEIQINGFDIDTHFTEAKSQLGVVPQEFNFNIFEQCEQIVINQAGYYGIPRSIAIPRARTLFKQLGLSDKQTAQAGQLSGGMKRRLMIARSLIHNPTVLILDEPTAGVDISLRQSMWSFLKQKNKEGLTIILTTHYLEEAEQLCKHIAIINHGQLISNTSMNTLLKQLNSETFILHCQTTLPNTFPPIPNMKITPIDSHTLEVDITQSHTMTHVISQLNNYGILINRIQNKRNRLEELFLKLVESPQ